MNDKITKYKTSNGIMYFCQYHVVWCTKYRRSVLTDNIQIRLKELILSICQDMNVEVVQLMIDSNQVQLTFSVEPKYGMHRAIKRLKRETAHVLKNEFTELKTKLPTLWTNNYFVSTSSEANIEMLQEVEQFFNNQKRSQRE